MKFFNVSLFSLLSLFSAC